MTDLSEHLRQRKVKFGGFINLLIALWRIIEAGNECGVMVHGQEHSCWSVPFLEQYNWKVIQVILCVEGASFLYSRFLCNVSLLSVSASRV